MRRHIQSNRRQCNTLHHTTIQHNTTQGIATHHKTVQHNPTERQHNIMQYITTQTQCTTNTNRVQYNAIQDNTLKTQHNAIQ